jgi:integrase
MARAKASPLSIKKQRLEFPIARKPVFESLGDGVSIGYRRTQGAGSWVARVADGKGGSWQKVIGLADDYEDANGGNVLSWAQAQAQAFALARAGQAPSPTEVITVTKALDRYEADLKTRGGDTGNVQRLRLHIVAPLLNKAVARLTAADLRDWRDRLAKTLMPSTVNRTANAFKATLNLTADHDDSILTRNAWEKGLASLPDAEEARNVVLSDTEIKVLIDAAYQHSGEFGLLVEVAAVTGSRYGQIAGLLVEDLQDHRQEPRLMMPSSKKGKGVKKVLRRPVPIPSTLAKRLRVVAGDRSPTAPLLVKPGGDGWKKSDHSRPFNRAVSIAFDDEKQNTNNSPRITLYALRHSSIVRHILRGVPVRVVAVMHDTSVAMIEKNYSKYLADHSDAIARTAMFDIGDEARPEGGSARRNS